ncbi:MAG: ATP synthase F0 subunit B [Planctomycetes bacterium]|nr:ATP synthase F0 subunit B [Planctomycetota bacterium]
MSFFSLALLPFASGSEGGFNPIDFTTAGNLVWTLLIFFVSVPLIWLVVMGPVTKALVERDAKTEQAIATAEKASKDALAARADLEKTLSEAQANAAKLVAEARAKGETRGQEILEAAKNEAGQMIEGARKAIRIEQDKAVAAIRNEVVELSLRAATQVLGRNVGGDDDRRFAAQVVAGEKSGRG